jgi:hypothetical protein
MDVALELEPGSVVVKVLIRGGVSGGWPMLKGRFFSARRAHVVQGVVRVDDLELLVDQDALDPRRCRGSRAARGGPGSPARRGSPPAGS